MMRHLVEETPLAPEEFARILAAHREFIQSGGAGGSWTTFCTSTDPQTDIVLGIYQGATGGQGRQADLTHQRLDGLQLAGVSLPFANLCGVSCVGQDLSGADLTGSLMVDSDFSGSILRGARLAGADLSRSELRGCDLREADLSGADLEDTDLTGSDLRGAITRQAGFKGTVVDQVVGLLTSRGR